MKTKITAIAVALLLGTSMLLGQGSGTTTTTTATKKTAAAKTTKKSSYATVRHVNGVVTTRTEGAITVKVGTKSRRFTVAKGTKFVGTDAAKGAKVKISYRSNARSIATEVRRRG